MPRRFKHRTEAGVELAKKLAHLWGQHVIVVGLARGGMPVAAEVARELHAPLDLLNVRRLTVPWHGEVTIGAIATGGVRVLNHDVIMALGITSALLEESTALQRFVLERWERVYRGGRPVPSLRGRIVVVVDDGIVTGATARAAIAVIKAQHPRRLVLATPVAQSSVAATLAREVDELVSVVTPGDLVGLAAWYDDLAPLDDDEVRMILCRGAPVALHAAMSVLVS